MTEPGRPPSSSPSAPVRRSAVSRWLLRPLMFLLGTGVALAASAAVLVVIALAVAYPQLPQIDGLADYRPKLPMRIYSADGVMLGEFGEERRRFVPIAQIPKVMQDAVLAIEDARFYQHGGVDYLGVIRAGLANFGEARSQGASYTRAASAESGRSSCPLRARVWG